MRSASICEPFFQLDVRQRGMIIKIPKRSLRLLAILRQNSLIQLVIDHLRALQKYEQEALQRFGYPSEVIRIYERRRKNEISYSATTAYDDAVAKDKLAIGSRSKITAPSKGLLKLCDLVQHDPDNIKSLERDLLQRIATTTKGPEGGIQGTEEGSITVFSGALFSEA